MNISVYTTQLKRLKTFVELLSEKNPGLTIDLHTSFNDFPEQYKDGKFVTRAHKYSHGTTFILKVDDNFDLPFDTYENKMLICDSWRNNTLTGGVPESINNSDKNNLPVDFDVIMISGNPKKMPGMDVGELSFYVIGGTANEKNSSRTRK